MALVHFQHYHGSFYRSSAAYVAFSKTRGATYCSSSGGELKYIFRRISHSHSGLPIAVLFSDRQNNAFAGRDRSVASSYASPGDEFSPESTSVETSLRGELVALLEEVEETLRRAGSARSRFMRLTVAVEKLRDSASRAVKAGNEAAARRHLEEKSRVMNALENARQRAGLLEALAAKLREAIYRKESVLIATIYAAKASSPPSTSSQVHVVSPCPPPPGAAASGSADYLRSLSDDELKAQFFGSEREELERMLLWRQNKDADQDSEKRNRHDSEASPPDRACDSSEILNRSEIEGQSEPSIDTSAERASDADNRILADPLVSADGVSSERRQKTV